MQNSELFIVEVPYNSITEGVDVIINAIEEANKKFTFDTYSPCNIANLDDKEEERTLIVGPGFYSYAEKSVYKSSLNKHVDGGLDAIEEFYREGLMLG